MCRDSVTLKKTTDSDCMDLPKPTTIQECNTFVCSVWVLSDWSPVSVCVFDAFAAVVLICVVLVC